MQATEKMIGAASDEAPELQREQVTRIVQAALDAQTTPEPYSLTWTVVAGGAAAISAIVTFVMVLLAPMTSGTWLDPRVWSGEYVPGDVMASSLSNGTWMMEAAAGAAPWVFTGLWALLIGTAAVAKKFKHR